MIFHERGIISYDIDFRSTIIYTVCNLNMMYTTKESSSTLSLFPESWGLLRPSTYNHCELHLWSILGEPKRLAVDMLLLSGISSLLIDDAE